MAKKKKNTKKNNRKRNLIIAVSAAMILLFCAFLGAAKQNAPLEKPVTVTAVPFPDYSKITVEQPKIKEMLLTRNKNSRPGLSLKKIKGIVIHYTANPGTSAKANRNYFESRKNMEDKSVNKVSSHYIIGLSGEIIQCIPDYEIAYASNERNKDTLSIECCHPDSTGKFSKETYQSLIHLAAYLADRYEFPLDGIIRHYDVTGKKCPKYYVRHQDAWERLKNDIRIYLKKNEKKS